MSPRGWLTETNDSRSFIDGPWNEIAPRVTPRDVETLNGFSSLFFLP